MSIKNFVAGLAVAALVCVGSLSVAHAQTPSIDQLLQQIAALTSQLNGLQGGSSVGSACTFTRPLTMGSQGADVSCLQNALIASGHAISAGATGYFGAQTKAAVMAWQMAAGVSPAAGYFGPISQAKFMAMMPGGSMVGGGTTLPAGCTSAFGYSTVTGQPCAGVVSNVPGCTSTAGFSSTTGQPCSSSVNTGALIADGSDGSVTVSLSPSVGTGVQIKKGETKDVIAIRAQATAGKVAVSRFDVHTNVRPWLYFGKMTLKDSSGNVLATKTISGPADATEVTVGSDYLIRFDGLNHVVTPGTESILVVSAMVLPTTDKLSSDVSVTFSVPAGSIRTVNGKGYTDSLGDTTNFTRSVTLLSTGSTADIALRISPNTPIQRIVATDDTNTTNDVVLGVYDLKSSNTSATLNSLNFAFYTSVGGPAGASVATSTYFSNIRLCQGVGSSATGCVGANSTAAGGTNFTSLNWDVPVDSWKSFTILANIAANQSFSASTTVVASEAGIIGIDSNFNTAAVSGNNGATSNDVKFIVNSGVSLSAGSASGVLVDNGSSAVSTSTAKFVFTLTNNGDADVYVSKLPAVFVATSTTSVGGRLTSLTASPATVAGDDANSFKIPAGTSRTLTLDGDFGNDGGTSQTSEFKITKVYFDDDTTYPGFQEQFIDYGLEALRWTAFLNN